MSTAVSFKGTREGIVIRLEGSNFEGLKKLLNHKIETAGGFFEGARVHLESEVGWGAEQASELEQICRRHGLIPSIRLIGQKSEPAVKSPHPMIKGLLPGELSEPCRLVMGTVRSGQSITSNGHLVILGDVNPGAQVTAVGNVLIFGFLRGTAHAGVEGDTGAFVAARIRYPSQVRIAGFLGRAGKEFTPSNCMEKAFLQENRICLEAFPYPEAY